MHGRDARATGLGRVAGAGFVVSRRPGPVKLVVRAFDRAVVEFAPPVGFPADNLLEVLPRAEDEVRPRPQAPQHKRQRLVQLADLLLLANPQAIRRVADNAAVLPAAGELLEAPLLEVYLPGHAGPLGVKAREFDRLGVDVRADDAVGQIVGDGLVACLLARLLPERLGQSGPGLGRELPA